MKRLIVLIGVVALVGWGMMRGERLSSPADFVRHEVSLSQPLSLQPLDILDRKYTPVVATTTEPSLISLAAEVFPRLATGTVLSLDQELQAVVYRALETVAQAAGYQAGAGVVMDVSNGELLTLVSYAPTRPVFNEATQGLYVPGSIIKPFVGLAALQEGVIAPEREMLSTGSIEVYTHNGETLTFKDWRPHGPVDMRRALGVSSNVYFYAIGGGHERQPGLGVDTILEYLALFGVGAKTGVSLVEEAAGMVPTPAWKQATYGDDWRLADTYHLAIGQHAYAVTPLQMTRATAVIATKGRLVTPTLLHRSSPAPSHKQLSIASEHFAVIHGGLEYAVQGGTAAGLYQSGRSLAVKTGTAEADVFKTAIHSWVIGYFPADKPQYAFTFLLTSGPWGEETGAVAVTADVMRWLERNRPEYLYTP